MLLARWRRRFFLGMPSFPNGSHICEVEIDPETGEATLDCYTVVESEDLVGCTTGLAWRGTTSAP